MNEIAIKAENISKLYKLGQIDSGYFFRDLHDQFVKKQKRRMVNTNADENPNDFWALKDINFEIMKGDRIGIIGRNGAGKSTLLKIISDITPPTTGKVKINGRVASLLEVGTGFNGEMPGRENIYMNGAILGMTKKEIDKKMEEIIEFSGIEHHLDTPVKRYSSGMYVRLAFAVAAHLESEILIADEVLAVGDASFQEKALGKMKELSTDNHRTVLFVSHNISSVRAICNKGILLDKGRIVKTGNIDEVISEYLGGGQQKLDLQKEIEELPYDSSFKMLNIIITQDEKIVSRDIGNGSPLNIEMVYEVKKAEVGFRVYFDVVDTLGELIFRSYNDEMNMGNSVVKPGVYSAKTMIPANLLGPIKYYLILRATIHNVRNVTGDGVKIPLSVLQTGNYNRAYPDDSYCGKLGISLEWKTQRLRDL